VDIESGLAEVRALPSRSAVAREVARLRREGLDGALAVAGTPLDAGEVAALLDRGVTLGAHPLDAYIAARDLAAAAAWVDEQRVHRRGEAVPLLGLEDVRRIHALATAGSAGGHPGAWRTTVVVSSGGIVSPPPWIVPFETGALLERFRERPAGEIPVWAAAFLARFARIRPFVDANRRTALLATTLVLRRLDVPPLVIPRAQAATFRRALATATAGDRGPLQALLARALATVCNRLVAAAGDDALVPLRALAGDGYAALIKAAKRGRLRAIERDGRVLSTAGWVAAYRAGRR
jgi:hypothetical protein